MMHKTCKMSWFTTSYNWSKLKKKVTLLKYLLTTFISLSFFQSVLVKSYTLSKFHVMGKHLIELPDYDFFLVKEENFRTQPY